MENKKNEANRIRNRQLKLRFTEDEFNIFMEKKTDAKINSYTEFVLRSVYKIPIFSIDTLPFLKLSEEINRIGININQIAKVANTSKNIYENDIVELQKEIEKINMLITENFEFWSKIKGGELNGLCKNNTD